MDNTFQSPPPVMRPVPAQHPPMYRELIHLRTAAVLAGIGVLLFFVGTIIVQSSFFISRGDMNYTDYSNLLRNIMGVGRILNWFGAMIISLPLYITGISNDNLDWKVRASMLSTATGIVVATMVMTMFISFPSMIYS